MLSFSDFLPTNKVCFDINLDVAGFAFLKQRRISTSDTSRVQWTHVPFFIMFIISLQLVLSPTSCFDRNRYLRYLCLAWMFCNSVTWITANVSLQLGSE